MHPSIYLKDEKEFDQFKNEKRINNYNCTNPECKSPKSLELNGSLKNKHGFKRGHKVICSRRYGKMGCGKAYTIYFNFIIKHHTPQSNDLWKLLEAYSLKQNISYAFHQLKKFTITTTFKMINKFSNYQTYIRSNLIKLKPPKTVKSTNPLIQTILHLRECFSADSCPINAYQKYFQTGIFSHI